jgi:hypothetical protein
MFVGCWNEVQRNAPEINEQLLQKVLNLVHSIVVRMLLYDLTRKNSQLQKFKDMVDAEQFQMKVIEDLMNHFDKHPSLSPEQSSDLVSNLSSLFKIVQEIELTPKGLFIFVLFLYHLFILFPLAK